MPASNKGKHNEIKFIAHDLKSMSDNSGITAVEEICYEIEHLDNDGVPIEKIKEEISKLDKNNEIGIDRFKEYINSKGQ